MRRNLLCLIAMTGAGIIMDFEQMAEATAWSKRWQNYQQYRPILEAARKWKAPIVALNARTETIRQIVRSGGIDRLPPEARKELVAKMQVEDPPYEKFLSLQMQVHASATPQMLHPMIEAQIARDEAMAQVLCTFMESEQGRGRKVLVLCGAGHVAYGLGLPTRVRRRLPDIKDRIVLFSESGEVRLSPEDKAQAPRYRDHARAVARTPPADCRLSLGQASGGEARPLIRSLSAMYSPDRRRHKIHCTAG